MIITQVQNTKTIFGNFIRPEEFADDMLEGLDPNEPESWSEALKELWWSLLMPLKGARHT